MARRIHLLCLVAVFAMLVGLPQFSAAQSPNTATTFDAFFDDDVIFEVERSADNPVAMVHFTDGNKDPLPFLRVASDLEAQPPPNDVCASKIEAFQSVIPLGVGVPGFPEWHHRGPTYVGMFTMPTIFVVRSLRLFPTTPNSFGGAWERGQVITDWVRAVAPPDEPERCLEPKVAGHNPRFPLVDLRRNDPADTWVLGPDDSGLVAVDSPLTAGIKAFVGVGETASGQPVILGNGDEFDQVQDFTTYFYTNCGDPPDNTNLNTVFWKVTWGRLLATVVALDPKDTIGTLIPLTPTFVLGPDKDPLAPPAHFTDNDFATSTYEHWEVVPCPR